MENPFEDPHFVHATKVEEVEGDLKLVCFPGGFRCYTHSDEREVMLLYNEIFIKQEYLGTNLTLESCRYIFDVGANIGLFTIFAKKINPDAIVHAFEPIKATYDVLVKNIALHGLTDIHVHNHAIGSEDGRERAMTFYPHTAGNSTAHPESKDVLKRILAEVIGLAQASYLFQSPQVQTVPSRTLSAVIHEEGVPSIDLLKIDTEGDELPVLQGISQVHYPIIRQIAAELHSETDLTEAKEILRSRGYEVLSETGIALANILCAVKR